MSQNLLIIEEVDVRRADDPDDSRVLTITKMGLPKLTRMTAEHTPGGGIGKVEFALPMTDAFQPTFSVKGLDTATLGIFGLTPGTMGTWIFAASVRNINTNAIIPLRSTITGVIGEFSPNEHTPGELLDCDHALREVKFVDLFLDGREIFAWDWLARIWRSNGIDRFAPYRLALGA